MNFRFGEKAEVTVIEESVIREEIKQYNKENKIINKDDIPLNEIKILSLSYKNIDRIDNLSGLDNLEKLQLDNNIIMKIENISHLVNLKWLDLSFNKIERIQGLSSLVQLTDLSLYNNDIIVVEGLETLLNLSVLSLGRNKIADVIQMLKHIKHLKKLEVLRVGENHFTHSEYKNFILVHLPELKFLDYGYIYKEGEKIGEIGKYSLDINVEENKEKRESKEEEDDKIYRNLGLLDLYHYDEYLLKTHDAPNQDLIDLIKVPDVFDSALSIFSETIRGELTKILGDLQKNIEERDKTREDLKKSFTWLQSRSEKRALQLLQTYQSEKKHCDLDWEEQDRVPDWRENIQNILKTLESLDMKLMENELELVQELTDVFKIVKGKLDDSLNIITNTDIVKMQDFDSHIKTLFDSLTKELLKEQEKRKEENKAAEEEGEGSKEGVEEPEDQDLERDNEDQHDDPLESFLEDDIQTQIAQMKESVESANKAKITSIRGVYLKASKEYQSEIENHMSERNRKSVQNIMNLIKQERDYWIIKLNNGADY